MPEFSHLKTDSEFPHLDTVDVFQYENEIDYGRFDIEQMRLQLCDVPWDVGEAHVGQRTISGIGNVVYFETPEARDAWFDAIPEAKPGEDPKGKCFRWSTKFKELHSEQIIDVPIPYNVAALFNYLVVTYEPFASKDDFLDYETGRGKLKWFWFVREVKFVAPNTTRLHLLDDAFQTWIYDVNIAGMVLERGHAPMFSTKASAYLRNPIANNMGLLTEDVNYGNANIVTHIDALALNSGDMWACIATSALPTGTWGTKADGNWKVPTSASYTQGGVPSVYVFAIETAELSTFLSTIQQTFPQFAQTVQAVFFVPKNLVTVSNNFEFANVTCHRLTASRQTLNLSQLSKSAFAYPNQYAEIAKLYTSPYAHIEITDENGNVDIVKVEDTSGTLDVSAAVSLSYPFVTIDAHLLGVGGTPSATITFRNVSAQTFKIQGMWYETLRQWQVPTFAIVQSPAKTYDYGTYFEREQEKIAYTNDYANAQASATTAQSNSNASSLAAKNNTATSASASYENATASAQTTKKNVATNATASFANSTASSQTAKENTATNASAAYDNAAASAQTTKENVATNARADKTSADANADTQTANAAIQSSANSAITSRSNEAASADTNLANLLSVASQAYEAGFTFATTNNEIDAKTASAAVGVGGGIAGSAVQGLMSGGPVGAVGGLISGAISGATSMIQTSIATNLSSSQAGEAVSLSQSKTTSTNTNNTERTTNQNSANSSNTSTTNTAITGTAANIAATTKANAKRSKDAANTTAKKSYDTEIANAGRTQDAANATAENSYDTAIANAGRTQTAANTTAGNTYDTDVANAGRTQTAANATAGNTYDTDVANAKRTYDTALANAARSRDTSINAVANAVSQAALGAPELFGSFEHGESATTKPLALFANVVTQSKSAIAAAGDEFLRYGYMYGMQWNFTGNWNVGKYFTYWKLRDFWVRDLQVPDLYMDKLRFFLFGGVTIWRKPEYIGKVSIYDNFN